MRYITHKRYKGTGLCDKKVNLPYGTILTADENGFLSTEMGDTVCSATSEVCKMYFAIDEDGNGLERGKLTWAIAYGRGHGISMRGFRFTDKQRDIITRHYQRFLMSDCHYIIFNDGFFKADVKELKDMAEELGIKL